ncbi:dynein intermediate chain 2, axonemal-like isoform X2 [Trichoplusia ni]|uniref:Dynein intermediate chain 2, axonemal-like isoform X2 n=1 Tax=Trichoplusia ni TaxID=7111 RepID=A0A7E5WDB5_TRINI|nr:dynein intermediate chain 2, axonemal-like isoform X2 [Trichoplusia ni]
MDITCAYGKLRSQFGRQPLFCHQGPEMLDSVQMDPGEFKHYVLRNPVHTATQHTPKYSQAEYTTSGSNHTEGGWPRDVNIHDPEATQRYRRKVEKDDAYIHCIMALSPVLDRLVLQNNAIDMYQTYYTELMTLPAVEHNSCRTVNQFHDFGAQNDESGVVHRRPVSSICWQPDGGHHFAATYVDVDMNRQTTSPVSAFVWNMENPNYPESVLAPPCPMLDLQYNPKDIQVLAGGLINGQVCTWDLRQKGVAPALICPPHVAHRDLVKNVLFINSKTGMEFFSGGPDGVCKWWDIRKIHEPTDEMIIDVVTSMTEEQSMAKANGISVMEYEPTIPTRFMVGTENGLVINGNRKGKTPYDKLPAQFNAHVGPVWRVERNPGFMKNFLTVGDWTARIWSEECRESSIMWTAPARHRITDGAWSPTRLSLMLLTQYDGQLTVWDLLRRQHEPVVTMQVCEEPLVCVRTHEAGNLLTCGSVNGNIFLLELSTSLSISEKNDKTLLTAILERESRREKILEARLREIRLKQRQADEASPTHSASDVDATLGDRDLNEAAHEFLQITKKELQYF